MTLIEQDARNRLTRGIALRIILDTDRDAPETPFSVHGALNVARFQLGGVDGVLQVLSEMAGGAPIPDDEWAAMYLAHAAGLRLTVERGGGWQQTVEFELEALGELNHLDAGQV